MQSLLEVKGLRVFLKIGCTEQERANPQPIDIDVTLKFSELVQGCVTDQLEDTVCYAKITQSIHDLSKNFECALIEKLAYEIFSRIRAQIPKNSFLKIAVTKVSPPLAAIQNGVRFEYGDSI